MGSGPSPNHALICLVDDRLFLWWVGEKTDSTLVNRYVESTAEDPRKNDSPGYFREGLGSRVLGK